MANLRRRIRELDSELTATKEQLSQNKFLIKQGIGSPRMIFIAVLSSFGAGFLLEYSLIGTKAKRLLMPILRSTQKFYKGMRTLLTVIAV